MQVGSVYVLPHSSSQEWAGEIVEMGSFGAALSGYNKQPDCLIDTLHKAAKERDILIAAVGAWGNFFPPDKASYEKALRHVKSIGSEWLQNCGRRS